MIDEALLFQMGLIIPDITMADMVISLFLA
jgi:hypothetical protein